MGTCLSNKEANSLSCTSLDWVNAGEENGILHIVEVAEG